VHSRQQGKLWLAMSKWFGQYMVMLMHGCNLINLLLSPASDGFRRKFPFYFLAFHIMTQVLE
jgi:hypothetical protein